MRSIPAYITESCVSDRFGLNSFPNSLNNGSVRACQWVNLAKLPEFLPNVWTPDPGILNRGIALELNFPIPGSRRGLKALS